MAITVAFGLIGAAQTRIRGIVVDEDTGEPVAGAFVMAYLNRVLAQNTMTDENGRFELECRSMPDTVMVSMMGYKPVKVTPQAATMTIKLKAQKLMLRQATVSAPPIIEKGDTVIYEVGAFKDAGDRVLKDLLEKLPGIEVTATGGVRQNEKPINKFYIDGLDLLGGRYTIATNNLDVDKISRIELYKNHQPVRVLQGVEDTERGALNIILKQDAKNTWLFTGDAALGFPPLPLFNGKAMITRFSRNSQDLYMVKGNNVGGDIVKELREQEYFGKSGFFLLSEENSDADFATKLNPRRMFLTLPKDYWYDNLSGIGTFNHLKRLGEDSQFKVSVNVAGERYKETALDSEKVKYASGDSIEIEESSKLTDNEYFWTIGNEYEKNGDKFYFNDNLTFSGQGRRTNSNVEGRRFFKERYSLPSLKLSNTARWTVKLNGRRAVTVVSDSKAVRSSHDAKYSYHGNETQQTLSKTNVVSENYASYSTNMGAVTIGLEGGVNFRYDRLNTDLDSLPGLNLNYSDRLEFCQVSPRVTPTFRLSVYGVDVRIRLPFSYEIISPSGMKARTYPDFSPSLNLRGRLGQNWEWYASGAWSTSKSDAENLLRSVVLTDYRRIFLGDSLSKSEHASVLANIKYSNIPAMFYAGLTAGYTHNWSDRIGSSFYSEDYTISEYLPLGASGNSYTAGLNMSKYFGVKTFYIGARANYSRTDYTSCLQGTLFDYTTRSVESSLTLRTTPVKWLVASASATQRYNRNKGTASFHDNSLIIEGSLSALPFERLILSADVYYRRQWLSTSKINNRPLVKCRAEWKFDKFSIFAEGRNLLNCKELRTETLTSYSSSYSSIKLRGIEALFGLTMKF